MQNLRGCRQRAGMEARLHTDEHREGIRTIPYEYSVPISSSRCIAKTNSDLLTSLANQNLDIAMGQVKIEQYLGFLSVFHDISDDGPMKFSVLTGVYKNQKNESNQKGAVDCTRRYEAIKVLDDDGEDVSAKFQSYAENMAHKSYDEEQSDFMRHTLTLASELFLRKDVSKVYEHSISVFSGS